MSLLEAVFLLFAQGYETIHFWKRIVQKRLV